MSEVTIYTEPGCPFCLAAKNDMKARGVKYTERDVTTDAEALAEMVRLTGGERVVPVIVEGGQVRIGFGGG